MGISVVGDVSAVKIIDGSQKTSFKEVFGESDQVGAEVGADTVLSLAEVDASAKAGQAPSTDELRLRCCAHCWCTCGRTFLRRA